MGLKHGSYAILVAGLTLFILPVLIAPKFSADTDLGIQMNTVDQEWHTEKELRISYSSNLFSKLVKDYTMKVSNLYQFDIEEGRHTVVTYKIYSNEIYVDEIRLSFDPISGGGGEGYNPILIPSDTLKSGDNSVRVVISIDSKAAEPRSTIDTFEFRIDSAVITDNKKLSAVILSTFILLFVVYEYWYQSRVTPPPSHNHGVQAQTYTLEVIEVIEGNARERFCNYDAFQGSRNYTLYIATFFDLRLSGIMTVISDIFFFSSFSKSLFWFPEP
jgi:hypothetical protein